MTKLVPRTELLEFCRETKPEEGTDLHRVWKLLERGQVIGIVDWAEASLSHERSKESVAIEVGVAEDAPANQVPNPQADGAVLGSYRLKTEAGFVIFTAVQGARGPVIYCAPALGLPGQYSELDMLRSVEFGTPINWDNILELINARN